MDRRAIVFEPALQEIIKMLYQNIWTKFKLAETGSISSIIPHLWPFPYTKYTDTIDNKFVPWRLIESVLLVINP